MEREVSEVDRKLFLRKTYLDKIHYYINRNPISQDELYVTVRKFFGEYLKLDYEFTYEELSQELNKVFITPVVKEHIEDFLIRLSESEYLEETILGTNEINVYLRELEDIIRNVIYDTQPAQEEDSFIHKVLSKHKDTGKIMGVAGINTMIEEINYHITNGHIDIAKSSYVNLLKAYDVLGKDDKKKLHDDLNEVYNRLQTLIKNPKSQISDSKIKPTIGMDKRLGVDRGADNVDKTVTGLDVSDAVINVRGLADETLFYINASNTESAKKLYADTLKLYESLNPDDKKILHSCVSELYTQLQAMLSRPKSIIAGSELTLKTGEMPKEGQRNVAGNVADTVVGYDNVGSGNAEASNVAASAAKGTADAASNAAINIPLDSLTAGNNSGIIGLDALNSNSSLSTQSYTASATASVEDFSSPINDNKYSKEESTISAESSPNYINQTLGSVSDASNVLFNSSASSASGIESKDSKDSKDSIADKKSSKIKTLATQRAVTAAPEISKSVDFSKPVDFTASYESASSVEHNVGSGGAGSEFDMFGIRVRGAADKSGAKSDIKSDNRDRFDNKTDGIVARIDKVLDIKSKTSTSKSPIGVNTSTGGTPVPSGIVSNTIASEIEGLHKRLNDFADKGIDERIDKGVSGRLLKETDSIKGITQLGVAQKGITQLNKPTDVAVPKLSPTVVLPTAKQSVRLTVPSMIPPAVEKLDGILKSIDDDIVMERFDKAKTSYKDALMFYRSMTDSNKAKCYEQFYGTFKRLDDALHKQSLNDILDKHLSDSVSTQRPLSSMHPRSEDFSFKDSSQNTAEGSSKIHSEIYPDEASSKILRMTTLPVLLVNDPETTRVYELIEESYFSMDNEHSDLAMLKYFKALELYHKLSVDDKRKLYSNLYDLFKKLSAAKKL